MGSQRDPAEEGNAAINKQNSRGAKGNNKTTEKKKAPNGGVANQRKTEPTSAEPAPAENPRDEPPSQRDPAEEGNAAVKIQNAMRAKDKKKNHKKKAPNGGVA